MIEELRNENMLVDIIADVATRTSVARRIVRQTTLPHKVSEVKTTANTAQTTANEAKQAAQDAGGVTNDNVAPLVPSGITVTVFEHNLSILWTPPAVSEYVEKARVRITPAGGTAIVRTTTDTHYIAVELTPNVVHDVEVQFEDRWRLTSGWSAPVQATPRPLIAEQIAASVQVAATQISGQLGNDQIAQITNPTKLAEAVYSTAVERGGRGANLLPFDRAEGAAYGVGSWPQKRYVSTSNGRDISIISHMGDLWWQTVTNATDTVGAASSFWGRWEDLGLGGDTYIYSAMVKNTGAADASARVLIEQATDTIGTGVITTQGSVVTIPADGKIYRIFVRWTNDKTRPFKRFSQSNRLASSTVIWNKFQLEEVSVDQLGPGRYTMPVFNAGALSARLIAAWDLTAVRAVIGDLTVESAKIVDGAIVTAKIADAQITTAKIMDAQITSAKINNIVADKITGGTIAAQTITLGTGGRFQAGIGTTLDNEGLKLSPTGSYDTNAWASSNKVSSQNEWGALMFYANTDIATNGNYRGIIVRASGVGTASGQQQAAVVLHAIPASTLTNQSARLELTSIAGTTGRGRCDIYGDVGISGPATVGGTLNVNGTIVPHAVLANTQIAASSTTSMSFISWAHGLGTYPTVLQGYVFNAPVEPIPNLANTVYFWELTTSAVKIFNENTTSRNAIVRAFK